ncbi:hypothetical protein M433DRAFT_185031 [Acidomyces richmondensis BFW]|nr:hypothetical protein M433DRAFT_185031 [Acidomyces richmondensis BFW]
MRLPKIWKGLRGSVYISDFHLIPDKNKHEVSDQTYNCPHNNKQEMRGVLCLSFYPLKRNSVIAAYPR